MSGRSICEWESQISEAGADINASLIRAVKEYNTEIALYPVPYQEFAPYRELGKRIRRLINAGARFNTNSEREDEIIARHWSML